LIHRLTAAGQAVEKKSDSPSPSQIASPSAKNKAEQERTGNGRAGDRETDWTKMLSNGATIELVGVSPHPSGPKTWWRPDGSPLTEAPYDDMHGRVSSGQPGLQAREFAIGVHGVPDADLKEAWKFVPAASASAGSSAPKGGRSVPGLRAHAVLLPGTSDTCTVRFGIGVGPWKTVYAGKGSASQGGEKLSVLVAKPREDKGRAVLTLTHSETELQTRVVAIDLAGKPHSPGAASSVATGGMCQLDLEFGLPLNEVKEFQFQTRPFEWAEFKNVALKPAKTAAVPSGDAK
jgi:hypothetical protein